MVVVAGIAVGVPTEAPTGVGAWVVEGREIAWPSSVSAPVYPARVPRGSGLDASCQT